MRRLSLALMAVLAFVARPSEALMQFTSRVMVTPFSEGEFWMLTERLDYEIRDTGIRVEVPPGFVTDFASIPQPFWSVLPTWGRYGPAAVVHDYLYWDQSCTREQADRIMALAMQELDVSSFRVQIIYRTLRLAGKLSWDNNAKAKKAGYTRVVPRDYPPLPAVITWAQVEKDLMKSGREKKPESEPGSPPSYCSEADRVWEHKT